jgi:hypothetical protein
VAGEVEAAEAVGVVEVAAEEVAADHHLPQEHKQ